MQAKHDTIPAGPEAPEDQARKDVEIMRAAGTLTSDTERAITVAARRHARFLDQIAEPRE